MNTLDTKPRAQVVSALVEANSLRATAGMTGVARMTVEKLLRDLGHRLRHVPGRSAAKPAMCRIQVDEIWSFVYAKAKNVTSWLVGGRDAGYATDLAGRLANRVQLTNDGHGVYLRAVEDAFGADIDYAMLVKHYGDAPRRRKALQPRRLHWNDAEGHHGNPDEKHISTSLRRAPEPHDADEHAPIHAPNERLLQEDRGDRLVSI